MIELREHDNKFFLINDDGEEIEIPEPAYRALENQNKIKRGARRK